MRKQRDGGRNPISPKRFDFQTGNNQGQLRVIIATLRRRWLEYGRKQNVFRLNSDFRQPFLLLWGLSRTSVVVALLLAVCGTVPVLAQTANSDNYKASEMQFGAGSSNESCSGNYCARASIGDIAGGESKSVSNTAVFGPTVPSEPLLEMMVNTGVVNLGVLTTETVATKTATMKIRTYLTDGYTLQITGDPPKYANHTLATPAVPSLSTPGIEQFGINLAANTTPNVGENPTQVPSGEFSFGTVLANYSTPNRFMYSSGDVVARSLTQTGQTDYTVSFIINISNETPAGKFQGEYSAVVTPIY